MRTLLLKEAESLRGAGRSGDFIATKNQLLQIFGEPTKPKGDRYKTSVEWVVEFEGNFFRIYDWKYFDGFCNDEKIQWNVGSNSFSLLFIEYVNRAIDKL